MVWVRSPVYFYKRNETFYFSRAIPSDLLHRFNKRKIVVSLRTKSEAKVSFGKVIVQAARSFAGTRLNIQSVIFFPLREMSGIGIPLLLFQFQIGR